ncbi:DUF4265 domain-containing protein [Burkholderia metallica]|uniref:DUF4265 domain-containing protein n=1 Tax=Burkholderia metallica TaxID=488729 RepID=UPI001575F7C9|nr:DUF4265 domain-containing protein [Burkholderia metallica]NTZ07189.1 DUF4265 domain-containing protein [Burkholderia metallica]
MKELRKIAFHLKRSEGEYPPVECESLWGIFSGALFCAVDNVPYSVYGVSKGDTVAVEDVDGELVATSVVARGGHSTLRVFAEDPDIKASIISDLKSLGVQCSVTRRLSLFAVDIPPVADFGKIDALLASKSDGEYVAYEDACLQHGGVSADRALECESLASVPLRLH